MLSLLTSLYVNTEGLKAVKGKNIRLSKNLNTFFLHFRCDKLDPLKVMSFNVWGNSWFNDDPVISLDEPYSPTEARAAVLQVINWLIELN